MSALVGYRYSARVPGVVSTRSSVGNANARLLPLAVGLASTTLLPPRSAWTVATWWAYSWVMPWLTSARARGGGSRGRSTPRLAGSAATARSWTSTADGSSARDASVSRSRWTSASAERWGLLTRRTDYPDVKQ